jgi:uroporphyrinogen decarboxylase
MTSRERLLCVLKGKKPDRIPISPFVQEEYLSYYFNKSNTSRLYDAVALRKELEFDLITRQYVNPIPYFLSRDFENWKVDIKDEVIGDNYIRTVKIATPEGELVQQEGAPYNEKILSGIHFSTIKYLIENSEEFELFKKYCPKREQQDIDKIINAGKEAREAIGDYGINCPWAIGGVYNLAATYMNLQNMLCDALMNPDYYQEYMDFFADMVAEDYKIFADSEFDAVGIQGNIANGAIMGEEYFDEYVMPYEKKAIEVLIKAGKPTIYHNCGNAANLYPCYKRMGITVWETVAPSPRGDNSIAAAKEYFGDSIILSGNFDQVHFLKDASPEEVEEAAYQQMIIGKQGGHFIFSCSDYLEVGTPLENVKAMLRGALKGASLDSESLKP